MNNTVNKIHVEFNDFIYSGLDTIMSLQMMRSEERLLYSQAKVQWKQQCVTCINNAQCGMYMYTVMTAWSLIIQLDIRFMFIDQQSL